MYFVLAGLVRPIAAQSAIVINEIHYNPAIKTDLIEFIELFNNGTNAVDLSGWQFTAGVSYTFPSGTLIATGTFRVIAQNPAVLAVKFPGVTALGPYTGSLSKYGEKLTLVNAGGGIEDEVEYGLGFPWPTIGNLPDASIELTNPDFDNNLGGSWRPSKPKPTPGAKNSAFTNNLPPQVRQVEHHPEQPVAGEVVTLSAKVTDPDGVASVTLQYQLVDPGSYIESTDVAYTNNWTSLAMNDTGTGGDELAGDDVYTVQLPGSFQVHRRLVRYRIIATDTGNRSIRVPYADDAQLNFAYFVYDGVPAHHAALRPGTTTAVDFTTNVMRRLQVVQLIARSNTVAKCMWFDRYRADVIYPYAGTLVYDGQVFDNIHFRARGGVWRYSMVKNMWKIDLNRGHYLEPRDDYGQKFKAPWAKVNLGACIQQGDFNHRGEQGLFESVGFKLFRLAGINAPKTFFLHWRVIDGAQEEPAANQYEGDFWGLYLALENEDQQFLEEHDLPDGNLYKMEGGTGTLNNQGATEPSNSSDLNTFLNTYNGPAPTDAWWRTNLYLPHYFSYQTIVQGIHHYDIADGKNYFYFHNPTNGIWDVFSWDLDLTWADNMYRGGQTGGDEPFKSRLLNDFAIPGARPAINVEFRNRVRELRDLLFNNDQAFKLIDEMVWILRGSQTNGNFLDADRFQWDFNPKMDSATYSENPASKAGTNRFYQWPNEPTVSKSFEGAIQLMRNYIGYRSTNTAFSLDKISAEPLRPARPVITYAGPVEYPVNQLTFNTSPFSGSAAFASLRWRIAEVSDYDNPLFKPDEPRHYEIETVWDSGEISPFNANITIPAPVVKVGHRYRVRCLHKDTAGRTSNWSLPIEFTTGEPDTLSALLANLRITEVMYNPAPGGYEFIELHNLSSSVMLDLSGVRFTTGIDYTFSNGVALPPGGYALLVKANAAADFAAFRAYYNVDAGVPIFGPYSGTLDNGGEQLTLRSAAGGSDVVNFNYSDGRGWPVAADGAGHSLVLLDAAEGAQAGGSAEYGGNWRASTYLRGSAGRADRLPPPGIVLNEIAANTDLFSALDSNDWIELYNPTTNAITLGPGWYLSDDGALLTKWMIPSNTLVPARGWVSFDEVTGFHNPTNIGFGLSKGGEQVFLSYLPGTAEDRVVDSVSFKAQERDWSWGRYPDGGAYWAPLQPRTRDLANAPLPASVMINEILYHPPDIGGTNDNSLDEFVELANFTGSPVDLFNTNGTWRIDGAIGFTFPSNLTLNAAQFIVLVNFNPTNATQLNAFNTRYNINGSFLNGATLLGPYSAKLPNGTGRVALERPQTPDLVTNNQEWVIVDEVIYGDQFPWPNNADGTPNSLQRFGRVTAGSDPANWNAGAPTMGLANNVAANAPFIAAQPQSKAVTTNSTVAFSVEAYGVQPLRYQWQHNGVDLPGATGPSLRFDSVQAADAGDYLVVIANAIGTNSSATAVLSIVRAPVIVMQPTNVTVVAYQDAAFMVVADGPPPLSYQWRFNGANLSGATSDTLLLTAVQPGQAGGYSALVFNGASVIASAVAVLTVNLPPIIAQQPTNVTVNVSNTVTFSVTATGTGLLRYQWRFNGADILNETNKSLVLANVQLANSGSYTVKITDNVGPITSIPAILTVLQRPQFLQQPQGLIAVQGDTVSFSVSAIGTQPMTYKWRRNGLTLTNNATTLGATTPALTLLNVQTNQAGSYTALLTNIASAGALSAAATLVVLEDKDGDHIPDVWETQYGLNPNSAADALIDSDGDRMTNLQEYLAGTDPKDPLSFLRIDLASVDPQNNVTLQFNAVSNRTYSVISRNALGAAPWDKVADVNATPTNRVMQVSHPGSPVSQRYYRLVTPKTP